MMGDYRSVWRIWRGDRVLSRSGEKWVLSGSWGRWRTRWCLKGVFDGGRRMGYMLILLPLTSKYWVLGEVWGVKGEGEE